MEDTPSNPDLIDDGKKNAEEDRIKRHPIYRFGFALVLGFGAGFSATPALMYALGLRPVSIDAYILRTELEQNYVLKEDLQAAKASLDKLSQTNQILAAALQSEQAMRRAAEQGHAARMQICSGITQQIKELQSTQTFVEDRIQKHGSVNVFWTPTTAEAKERDALELENLQKRSARLQESLLELRRQLATCGATSAPTPTST